MFIVTFVGSILGGLLLTSLKKLQVITFFLLLTVALYTNRNHIKVNLYTDVPISLYIDSETTTNTFNEYLPLTADSRLLNTEPEVIEPEELQVINFKQNTKSLQFDLYSDNEASASVRQFYFPGQTLYVNKIKTPYLVDDQGKVKFITQKGNQHVEIRFEQTNVIIFAKFITLLGLLTILYLTLYEHNRRHAGI